MRYTANDDWTARDAMRELVQLGSKVTSIGNYGFNNCKHMRGVLELPNVTDIGYYALAAWGFTDIILLSMTHLVQESFYCAPSPSQIHADNVKSIDYRFWEFYGPHLTDLYLRNSTCA